MIHYAAQILARNIVASASLAAMVTVYAAIAFLTLLAMATLFGAFVALLSTLTRSK